MAKVRVCQGGQCAPLGAVPLLRDLEDLAGGACDVVSYSCLGNCGKGPNVEVVEQGVRPKLLSRVKTFKKACEVLEGVGVDIPPMAKKSGKQKFEIRRETDAAKRMKKLGEAFQTLGGDAGAKRYPPLYAALLLMRAQETQGSKDKVASAVGDTQMALTLIPNSAQAYIAHATALEAAARCSDGLEVLEQLLASGIKGSSVPRVYKLKDRLERKAEHEESPETSGAKAKPAAKGKPKTKAKVAAKAKGKPAAKANGAQVSEPAAEAAPKEDVESTRQIMEDPPVFFDWRIDSVKELGRDTIELRLACPDAMVPLAQWTRVSATLHAAWHVNLRKDGDDVIRAYTPVSDIEAFKKGRLDIMLKIYPDGVMTQHVSSLPLGEGIGVSGPAPTVDPGEFGSGLAMVAGGSAVTIALQLCEEVLQMHADVYVFLFLCFRTVADAHYTEQFDRLSEAFPKFERVYCISSGELPGEEDPRRRRAQWHAGRINEFLLSAVNPGAKSVLSGPPGLLFVARRMLLENGHDPESILLLDPAEEPPGPPGELFSCQAVDGTALESCQDDVETLTPPPTTLTPPPADAAGTLQPTLRELPEADSAQNPTLSFFQFLFGGLRCCPGSRVAPDDVPDEGPNPMG